MNPANNPGSRETPPRLSEVVYNCPCGSRIRLSASVAGRKARCRKCGRVFTVPAVPSPRFEPPPVVIEIEPDEDDLTFRTVEPENHFWSDLACNFVFFVFEGNMITMFVIAFMHFLLDCLSWMPSLFFWRFAILIAQLLLAGWLCAFYLATTLHAAGGEDDLPNSWSSDWLELVEMFFQFLATALIAMLPWIVLRCLQVFAGRAIPDNAFVAADIGAIVIWPAIVLTLAIGRSLGGLWPHVVLRVPLAGPIAYLAVCVTVAAALVLTGALDVPYGVSPAQFLAGLNPWAEAAIGSLLTAYAAIVSMRAVGLYYRHYKHRLPFEAE